MRKLTRAFYPYPIWEDLGMWMEISSTQRRDLLPKAIKFTGDAALYGSFMQRVIKDWPLSSAHNLSDLGQNRKAWIGHAACFMAISSPEYITREAWAHLTQKQQDDANAQAQMAIDEWEYQYEEKDSTAHSFMGTPWLLGWNTGRGPGASRKREQGRIISLNLPRHYEERPSPCQPWLFAA